MPKRILITGATGNLGRYLVNAARRHFHEVTACCSTRQRVNGTDGYFGIDLHDAYMVARLLQSVKPHAVIHAAAIASVEECRRDPQLAQEVNVTATAHLAAMCAEIGAKLVYVSTDLVFNGQRGNYNESDAAIPISTYGQTKLQGEKETLRLPANLVARVSWLVGRGPPGRPNFLESQIAMLRQNQPVTLFRDEWRSPLAASAAAEALVRLVDTPIKGLLHLGGPERLSRYEMGLRLASVLGVANSQIRGPLREEITTPEPRPRDVSLDSALWRSLMPDAPWPTFEEALSQVLAVCV